MVPTIHIWNWASLTLAHLYMSVRQQSRALPEGGAAVEQPQEVYRVRHSCAYINTRGACTPIIRPQWADYNRSVGGGGGRGEQDALD